MTAMADIGPQRPLYARVLGEQFDRLTPALRTIHEVCGERQVYGRAIVELGSNWLSRLVVAIMRLPPAGDYELWVHFRPVRGGERWTRHFGSHRFRSRLRTGGDGRLVETIGPISVTYRLAWDGSILAIDTERWSVGPLPLPKLFRPRSAAREWEEGGRFHFDVPIDLPIIGRVVRYRGWLQP